MFIPRFMIYIFIIVQCFEILLIFANSKNKKIRDKEKNEKETNKAAFKLIKELAEKQIK